MAETKLSDLCHLFVTVFLSSFAGFILVPAGPDVTLSAVCPGQDQCSLAIFLTAFQQGVSGLGSVIMMPILGNLSDKYGRKTLLIVPLTFAIAPLVIMAYSRTTNFFYAYYILKTLTGMASDGSVDCIALAYLADTVSESQRASTFGILAGVQSASFVSAMLAARILSTSSIFQVAAVASILAALYMGLFLKESLPKLVNNPLTRRILEEDVAENNNDDLNTTIPEFKNIPSPRDIINLLKSSKIFAQITIVTLFHNLSLSGEKSSLLYFLKVRFQFNKDQFADLWLIQGGLMTLSQLFFMPLLVPVIGEKKLLSISLLASFTNLFLLSIAWSVWIPYAVSVFNVLIVFIAPCIRSIVSKQVCPHEQGKAQGCISGVTSFANIMSPLIFSPLTALFLSEKAPFAFPGFSIMCIGLSTMIAFIQSVVMKVSTPISSNKNSIEP